MRQLRAESTPCAATTSSRSVSIPTAQEVAESPAMKKRDRKAAKKALKRSHMAKSVTTADVELVGDVLHSSIESEWSDLAEHQSVHEYVAFHKGTVDVRESRKAVKKDRKGSTQTQYHVPPQTSAAILQVLDVTPITNATSAKDKMIIRALQKKIDNAIVKIRQEEDEIEMRRAGFWRWASKKAFKRLQSNGGIWDKKDSDLLSGVKAEENAEDADEPMDEAASALDSDESVDAETKTAEPGDEPGPPADENLEDTTAYTTAAAVKVTSTPELTASADIPASDDGWTTVASKWTKSSAKGRKQALPKLTLVANRGLEKLAQSSTPRSAKLSPDLSKLFG